MSEMAMLRQLTSSQPGLVGLTADSSLHYTQLP